MGHVTRDVMRERALTNAGFFVQAASLEYKFKTQQRAQFFQVNRLYLAKRFDCKAFIVGGKSDALDVTVKEALNGVLSIAGARAANVMHLETIMRGVWPEIEHKSGLTDTKGFGVEVCLCWGTTLVDSAVIFAFSQWNKMPEPALTHI